MTLTLGIDARAATEEGAGGGRVVRELIRALGARPEPHRYLLFAREAWDHPLDERFSWRPLPSPDPLWHLRTARAANHACDAFLSTNSYLTVWFLRIPGVPMVFDLVSFDSALRPQRRSGLIERLTLPVAVRRSSALIAISEATSRALTERFASARGKVRVVPLAASGLEHRQAELPQGVPVRDFLLAVGTLEPRKNLPRLVDAYRRLPAEMRRAHPLVVTGRLGWQSGETLAALGSLGDAAVQTGFVTDEQLALLYRRCVLFAYPSLGEGFGLPVLEAMAAGAPVLTSNRSSLPEVGGDAAAYCDPTDTADIAAHLQELLGDPARRDEMRDAGAQRARAFSWDRTARSVLDVLEGVTAPH